MLDQSAEREQVYRSFARQQSAIDRTNREAVHESKSVIDLMPRRQFGYINPVQISDYIHYQFYGIFPPNCLMVSFPLNLQSFSHGGVDKALEGFWSGFDFLVDRKVERISQGGIPVSAYAGRARILAMLEEAAKRASISATADFEELIQAVRQLGIKRLAVAAKLSPELMQRIREYLGHAGITPVGVLGQEHSAQQVVALKPQESVDVALALGEKRSPRCRRRTGCCWQAARGSSCRLFPSSRPSSASRLSRFGASYGRPQGGLSPIPASAG